VSSARFAYRQGTAKPSPAAAGAAGAKAVGDAACLSSTKGETNDSLRFPRARTLEVISNTIRELLEDFPKSSLWVTVTFPRWCVGRKARQSAFDRWRKAFLEDDGYSVWVIEPHASGEVHFHGVWSRPGNDYQTGFDFEARERWVKSRSLEDFRPWKKSGSPSLQAVWRCRPFWRKVCGLGWVDIVPLRPSTVPQAVARYMASYASQGQHPKGTRLVRRIGFKGKRSMLKSNEFSFCGPRSRLFGRWKMLGDKGPPRIWLRAPWSEDGVCCFSCRELLRIREDFKYGKRQRGWALRAAIDGAGMVDPATLPFPYLDVWDAAFSLVRNWKKDWSFDQCVSGVKEVFEGRFWQ